MHLAATVSKFESINIHKLLRKDSVSKFVLVAKIIFVALTFIALVLIVYQAINSILSTQTLVSALEREVQNALKLSVSANADKKLAEVDYSNIVKHNIFGPLETAKPKTGPETAKPAAKLNLGLVGTFVSDEGTFAIIEDQRKKVQDVFQVNQSIFDDGTLKAIYPDRVELLRNGQTEILTIDEAPDRGPEFKDGVASLDENEYIVQEAELDKALENLPLLLTQARAVPYFKDGKSIGLRLFAVKAGSLFEKIGLRNGDILKSINGSSLADLSQAIKLFERLKEERSINVSLERNQVEREFKYQIR